MPVDLAAAAPASRPTVVGDAWHDAIVAMGHDFAVSSLRLVAAYGALASRGSSCTRASVQRRHARRRASSRRRVAGKTGTADLAHDVVSASFIGFVPAEAPRYVVLVAAETKGGGGPATAAPRFSSLVSRAFR